jgi:hypothetical protein
MEWVWRNCLSGNSVSDELGQILDHLIQQSPKNRARSAQAVLQMLQPARTAARSLQTPKTTPSAPEPQKQSPVHTTAPARPAPQKHPNQLPLKSQLLQVPNRWVGWVESFFVYGWFFGGAGVGWWLLVFVFGFGGLVFVFWWVVWVVCWVFLSFCFWCYFSRGEDR